ncbi:MAG: bacterial Ig-like domain-containing protein [Actinomycetes bacterium]
MPVAAFRTRRPAPSPLPTRSAWRRHRAVALGLISTLIASAGGAVAVASPATAAARDGIPVAVTDSVYAAVEANGTPALPDTVEVTTDDGGTREADVTWDLSDLTFDQHYRSIPVPGTVEGVLDVEAQVEVVPDSLVYFIDAGTAGRTSASFVGVKALVGDQLLNDVPDQAAATGTWGFQSNGLGGTRVPSPYVPTLKSSNGHYGLNNSALELKYTLTELPAGTYTVTAGIDEWWSGPRTQQLLFTGGGATADTAIAAPVQVSSSSRTAITSGTMTLTESGEVTLKFRRTAGSEAPVVSWIAVAAGTIAVDTTPLSVAAPTASVAAGSFATPQEVSLATATAGASIYYTTDGSAPSRTNGTRAEGPITVATTTSIRAIAVKNGAVSTVARFDSVLEPVPDGGYTQAPIGRTWYDTDGNPIQAHGGGFLQKDGWYYWIGENKSHDRAVLHAVSLYRSQDLLNWEFVHDIVTTETPGVCETGIYPSAELASEGDECKIERPKLLYNEATDTYVMWGHWETENSYSASHLIVATSDTIDGDYEIVRNYRPGVGEVGTSEGDPTYPGDDGLWGYGSRDFTVFKDPDTSKAYLISAQDHQDMRVYPLTDDYTDVIVEESYPLFVGGHREAPAVVKIDGRYFVLTSGQSGWYPNQTRVASTTDLSSPDGWSELTLVGNNTSFYSQPTNIITVEGDGGERSYLYMGDRWNSKKLGTSSYVWLPLEIEGDEVRLNYQPGWSFDPATATITTPRVSLVSEGRPAWATSESPAAPASRANDGVVTNLNLSGDSTNYFQPTEIPASWTVDLEALTDLSRIDLSWRSWNGSESRSTYSVYGSTDGTTWTRLANREANTLVGFTTDDLDGAYRYVRVDISSVINDHNGNAAVWAAGLVEVQVYAEAPVVEGLSVTHAPDKVDYLVGEALDLTGLVVTAAYSDGGSEVVANSALQVSGYDPETVGAQTVTVAWTPPGAQAAVTATFTVEVTAPSTGPGEVERIEVTSAPTKVRYLAGEELDLAGLVVTATFADGSSSVVPHGRLEVSGFDSTVLGRQTVVVTYAPDQAGARAADALSVALSTDVGVLAEPGAVSTSFEVTVMAAPDPEDGSPTPSPAPGGGVSDDDLAATGVTMPVALALSVAALLIAAGAALMTSSRRRRT